MSEKKFNKELEQERRKNRGLQKKLDSALKELAMTNSELLQLTLELEDRVDERTKELKQTEEGLERLNLALRAIRNVNKLITREKNRDRLIKNVARLLIETRAYHGSWIALLSDSGEISTIAEAGFGDKFLPMKDRLKSGSLPYCAKKALMQPGIRTIMNNLSTCLGCPLSLINENKGAMTVRLEHFGKVYGLLTVSLPIHLVDDEEKSLFQEVADDIAFALHRIELLDEREKVVEALRVSEENYRILVENQSDLVIRTDVEGRFQFVSPSFYTVFGKKEKELIGENFFHMIHEDDREKTKKAMEELYHPPYTCYVEHRVKTKDGWRWLAWADNAVLDENNNVVAVSAIGRDITDRKLAEDELLSTKERFRNLVETSSDWVWELDKNGCFTYVSPKATDIIGYKPKEIIGKTPIDFMDPKAVGKNSEIYSKFISISNPLKCFENTLLHKNGNSVITEASGVPFFDKNGELCGLRGITRDITKRKKAEEESVRLMTAIEQSVEGVIITNDNGIVQYINPAIEKIMGYLKEELIGQMVKSFRTPENEAIYENMYEKISKGEVWQSQFKTKNKEGKDCQIYATVSPIRDPLGTTTNYVVVARNVTNEVNMEKQLQQAQKMEAIGTLAGGIAHDFNNILSAVIGYTEISLSSLEEDTPLFHNLQEVLKAGDRAKDLVKQILTFSRQSDYEMQPIQVNIIVKEALKLLRATLPSTIEINRNIQSDSVIMGNPTKIHQVMMNLCTNAAHAMEGKPGIMYVGLTDAKLDAEISFRHPDINPGTYLKLTVEDTGHGMTPEVQERIFDPFFSTKKTGDGTGMGLSVVHGIIKSFGGFIKVYSEPGKGSVFNVFIPTIKQETAQETKIETPLPTGTEHILFIDDEQSLVEMNKQMLERLGYKVSFKTNSIEALDLFEDQGDDFDLVITDMTMPYMTGDELAKELLLIRPDIPIIICTGFHERLTKERAKSLGIRAFITKPVLHRELAETVRQVLDREVYN